jgi:hypothetical protein
MLGVTDGRSSWWWRKWCGPEKIDEMVASKTRRVLTAHVDVPRAGSP